MSITSLAFKASFLDIYVVKPTLCDAIYFCTSLYLPTKINAFIQICRIVFVKENVLKNKKQRILLLCFL